MFNLWNSPTIHVIIFWSRRFQCIKMFMKSLSCIIKPMAWRIAIGCECATYNSGIKMSQSNQFINQAWIGYKWTKITILPKVKIAVNALNHLHKHHITLRTTTQKKDSKFDGNIKTGCYTDLSIPLNHESIINQCVIGNWFFTSFVALRFPKKKNLSNTFS